MKLLNVPLKWYYPEILLVDLCVYFFFFKDHYLMWVYVENQLTFLMFVT